MTPLNENYKLVQSTHTLMGSFVLLVVLFTPIIITECTGGRTEQQTPLWRRCIFSVRPIPSTWSSSLPPGNIRPGSTGRSLQRTGAASAVLQQDQTEGAAVLLQAPAETVSCRREPAPVWRYPCLLNLHPRLGREPGTGGVGGENVPGASTCDNWAGVGQELSHVWSTKPTQCTYGYYWIFYS